MSADAYRLRLDRPLDREAARLFRSQVNRARRALKHPNDEAVHTARKALKRARAVLRLVRSALPEEDFDALDAAVRDVGRRLGPVRDTVVAQTLVDVLTAEGALPTREAHVLALALDDRLDRAHDALATDGGPEALRATLDGLRLDREALAGLDTLALHDGLVGTYRRGHKRLARAAERGGARDLHAWRRQVKHLGYQLRILTPAWPLVLGPTARAFDRLGALLGDDHDLDELARFAHDAGLEPKPRRAVARLARSRRAALQETVWPLGARCYAEPADAFAGRVTLYLAAAFAEAHGTGHPLDGVVRPSSPDPPLASVALAT